MGNQTRSKARKESILKAAGRVFAQKGFHDATIAEVAQQAEVSEGTIYEYFGSKEKLLFSIPGTFARKFRDQGQFHLSLIRGAANRLRAIVYLYLHTWQENPDYAAVNLLILKTNLKFRQTEGYRLIREGFRDISQIIEDGIANGEFQPHINPYMIRSVLMGAVDHVTTNWLLSDRNRDLLEAVDPIVDVVLDGISNDENISAQASRPHWSTRRAKRSTGPEEA